MVNIDFSSGASYFSTPDKSAAAAIESIQNGNTTYGPTEGTVALRRAISERYQKEGIDVSEENVLVTPGSKQALFNLFTVLLDSGDEVVVPTPAWFGFHGLLEYSKGSLVSLITYLKEEYVITPEALREVLTDKSRILLLTNPANPTGRLYRKEELESILEVTADYPELYIISDEIYDHDTYGDSFTSVLSCKGAARERTIVVNGFSKTFAMSGWRIGYLIGPADVVAKSTRFQANTLSGVSVFSQDAALAALQHLDEALPPMLSVLQEHRKIMEQSMQAIPDVRFFLPDGAYYFFPDFSSYFGRSAPTGELIENITDLCQYLQHRFKLQLSPGDHFGAPGHARVSFAIQREHLIEGLDRLKQALASLR